MADYTQNLDQPVRNAVGETKDNERKLSFLERIYLPGIFSGLMYTLKQMFQPTFTMQYPEEKWDPPAIFRGRPVLVKDDGQERCVACGLCARACPPLAISMQASDTEDEKERYPQFFEINMLRCIYCGFCEEVCPEEAIVMSKDYDLVFHSRGDAIYDKEKLLIDKADLKERLDFLREYKNRQFGNFWKYKEENNIHSVRNRDENWDTSLSLVELLEARQASDKAEKAVKN